jgi:hypothetical protein
MHILSGSYRIDACEPLSLQVHHSEQGASVGDFVISVRIVYASRVAHLHCPQHFFPSVPGEGQRDQNQQIDQTVPQPLIGIHLSFT